MCYLNRDAEQCFDTFSLLPKKKYLARWLVGLSWIVNGAEISSLLRRLAYASLLPKCREQVNTLIEIVQKISNSPERFVKLAADQNL